jgi:predicted RNA-binding Zn-ribbon protein involved in translation (DUF1610 family)
MYLRSCQLKCPNCGNTAITFSDWCNGIKAFWTRCQSCNVRLIGSGFVFLGFFCTLIYVFALIPLLIYLASNLGFELANGFKVVSFIVLIVLAYPCALYTYKNGSYRQKGT